jgi:uncharacterized protein YoaH (UPF0181 family)
MTGTEERAAVEALRLMNTGVAFEEAVAQVATEFNLSGDSRAQVARAVPAQR